MTLLETSKPTKNKVEAFRFAQLKVVDIERGLYTFAELKDYVDWDIKRVYFFQRFKETGQHCHFVENEVFVVARGTCTAVIDRGNGKEEIHLSAPGQALIVYNHVWHGFKDASEDALVLALSSTNYSEDRSDYCEDYQLYCDNVRIKLI